MSWCPHSVPLYQQRQGKGVGLRTSAPCKTLSCPFCGPRKREADAAHYTHELLDLGDVVWRDTIPDEEFKAWAKRVERATQVYVRCPLKGKSIVFTNYPGKETIAPEGLHAAILEAIRSVPAHEGHRGRNVTSSHCLVPPRRKEGQKQNDDNTLTFPVNNASKFNERVVEEHRVLRTEGNKPTAEATRVWVDAEEMETIEWLYWAQRSGISLTTARTFPRRPSAASKPKQTNRSSGTAEAPGRSKRAR